MAELFHLLVFDPIYNLLILLYDTVAFEDFGIAIILVTLVIKFALYPLSKQQIESQKKMQDLQPKIKELQEKYKDKREQQAQELMKLYKKHKVNPLGGCLPILIQIIFFIALWRVLFLISEQSFVVDPQLLYGFVGNPGSVNSMSLGFLDLSGKSYALAIITALAQYWQMKMMISRREDEKNANTSTEKEEKKNTPSEPDMMQIMNTQMLYLFPLMTLIFGVTFSAGLVLYWLVSTLFMIVQQWILFTKKKV